MRNATTVHSKIGASNHSNVERHVNDFYATEPKALELLLDLESFSETVLEPACGQGHLSDVLIDRGYRVLSSDLIDRGYGETGVDFLSPRMIPAEESPIDIITNPPYEFAQAFVEQGMRIIADGSRIAMFLKLTFLESKKRYLFFQQYPPELIYVSSDRLTCALNGDFNNVVRGAVVYAWFIWRKGFTGEPRLRWFNANHSTKQTRTADERDADFVSQHSLFGA